MTTYAYAAHIEDTTAHKASVTAHMDVLTVYIEDTTAHTAPVTSYIEAATVNTTTDATGTSPGTIKPPFEPTATANEKMAKIFFSNSHFWNQSNCFENGSEVG